MADPTPASDDGPAPWKVKFVVLVIALIAATPCAWLALRPLPDVTEFASSRKPGRYRGRLARLEDVADGGVSAVLVPWSGDAPEVRVQVPWDLIVKPVARRQALTVMADGPAPGPRDLADQYFGDPGRLIHPWLLEHIALGPEAAGPRSAPRPLELWLSRTGHVTGLTDRAPAAPR